MNTSNAMRLCGLFHLRDIDRSSLSEQSLAIQAALGSPGALGVSALFFPPVGQKPQQTRQDRQRGEEDGTDSER